MEKAIKIGLLGLGTVGRGVYRILSGNAESIRRKTGARLEVARILVRDRQKDRGLPVDPAVLTTDYRDIVEDPEIEIVVEVMGGINPALEYSLAALKNGKSLVTANKDMVA
ncbi:MAG: homoserine dehydrogenase, partial [Desulfotomaculales bacterium]